MRRLSFEIRLANNSIAMLHTKVITQSNTWTFLLRSAALSHAAISMNWMKYSTPSNRSQTLSLLSMHEIDMQEAGGTVVCYGTRGPSVPNAKTTE